MGKRGVAIVVAGLTVAILITWRARRHFEDQIPYQGTMIKLSKRYADFDTYKNDPDNIAPFETARVQELVINAPIGHGFNSRLDLFRATGEIQFPGYGAGSGGGSQPDGSELLAVVIEVPRASKDRYIVFRGNNGKYTLVDDFVEAELPAPFGIREQNEAYIYSTQKGEAFRRSIAPANRVQDTEH